MHLISGSGIFDQNHIQPSGVGYWRDDDDYRGSRDGFPTGVITRFVPFFNFFGLGGGLLGLQQTGQVACDSRLARIFGDDEVVVASAYEPSTVDGNPNNGIRNRTKNSNEDPRNGVLHIFSNINGSPRSETPGFVGNMFVPKGFSSIVGKADPKYEGREYDTDYSNITVKYGAGSLSKFGYNGNLSIAFIHAGPIMNESRVPTPLISNVTNKADSILIGTIGADGSPYDGGGGGGRKKLQIWNGGKERENKDFIPTNYIHNHVIFTRTRKGKTERIDPRSVFCKDLGF